MIGKWDITSVCNLHCTHCCTGGQDYKRTRTLELGEVRKVMESLRDSGIKKLQFTGGEPLLRGDLPEVLAMTSKYFERRHPEHPWPPVPGTVADQRAAFPLRADHLQPRRSGCRDPRSRPRSGHVRPTRQERASGHRRDPREKLDITVTMNAVLSRRSGGSGAGLHRADQRTQGRRVRDQQRRHGGQREE